ncbi:MAG: hypothetical protein HGA45_06200 [Chloroflexales bacterium]|nr:hypothetical protein [Chloroflexales bacterium]
MDLARLTTELDVTVTNLQRIHSQVETTLATLPPTADASYRAGLEDLKGKLSRAKLTAMQSRDAGRALAPRSYQTETAGL